MLHRSDVLFIENMYPAVAFLRLMLHRSDVLFIENMYPAVAFLRLMLHRSDVLFIENMYPAVFCSFLHFPSYLLDMPSSL